MRKMDKGMEPASLTSFKRSNRTLVYRDLPPQERLSIRSTVFRSNTDYARIAVSQSRLITPIMNILKHRTRHRIERWSFPISSPAASILNNAVMVEKHGTCHSHH